MTLVREVARFETLDGAIHDTREEAEAHALTAALLTSLRALVGIPTNRNETHFTSSKTIHEAQCDSLLYQISEAIVTKHADKAKAIADILGR